MIATDLPPAPRNPLGPAPLRRPDSVRRTSSLDVTWPQGYGQPAHFQGRARDIYTPAGGGAPVVIKDDTLIANLAQDRTIRDIASEPVRPGIDALVGERGGGYLRTALNEALPLEKTDGSPLYLLIDDLSGASLVAGWAWSLWKEDWLPKDVVRDDAEATREARRRRMEGICTGFRPGSSALDDLDGRVQNFAEVPPLPHPDDPLGWHELTAHTAIAFRRARRIDAWREGDRIHIDAMFQDSATTPAGGRQAIHEYRIDAVADARTLTLLSVTADPRILPYPECPNAPNNLYRLHDTPLRELRTEVLERLRRVDGCTHLNDALRSMAEVPVLLQHLR
jgi:hypothetical protein